MVDDRMLEYDETDPKSIEAYGKKLIGMTFQDVCDQDDMKNQMLLEKLKHTRLNMKTRNEKVAWVKL